MSIGVGAADVLRHVTGLSRGRGGLRGLKSPWLRVQVFDVVLRGEAADMLAG